MVTVLQVAYPFAPVSLDATGGAEQVLCLLDRGLASRGHRSIVIACAGSRTAGHLLAVEAASDLDERSQARVRAEFQKKIENTVRSIPIDLVHMHGVDFLHYLPRDRVPVLATLHLPATYYPASTLSAVGTNTFFNCVSIAQQGTFPHSENMLPAIGNGILLERFAGPQHPKENYALALGRICPEKGYHLALDAAEKAGVPLWIAGAVFPYREHQQYFQEMLAPRLKPPHRFLGPVGFAVKRWLLSGARCLLVPSLVPETASLATMEAMACGTPVVAFSRGLPADLIAEGRTGFLVRDVTEMAGAIRLCGEIDGVECRRHARLRFSADRMVAGYLELYEQILIRTGRPATGLRMRRRRSLTRPRLLTMAGSSLPARAAGTAASSDTTDYRSG